MSQIIKNPVSLMNTGGGGGGETTLYQHNVALGTGEASSMSGITTGIFLAPIITNTSAEFTIETLWNWLEQQYCMGGFMHSPPFPATGSYNGDYICGVVAYYVSPTIHYVYINSSNGWVSNKELDATNIHDYVVQIS